MTHLPETKCIFHSSRLCSACACRGMPDMAWPQGRIRKAVFWCLSDHPVKLYLKLYLVQVWGCCLRGAQGHWPGDHHFQRVSCIASRHSLCIEAGQSWLGFAVPEVPSFGQNALLACAADLCFLADQNMHAASLLFFWSGALLLHPALQPIVAARVAAPGCVRLDWASVHTKSRLPAPQSCQI